jgi:hypothetical protein
MSADVLSAESLLPGDSRSVGREIKRNLSYDTGAQASGARNSDKV